MLKKIILIILIVLILGSVIFFLIPKEEKQKIGDVISSTTNESDEKNNLSDEFCLVQNGKTNYYDKGYYYIADGETNRNIKYFDYATRKEIYLCNKPNCKHNNSECSSYLDIADMGNIFVYNNNLYLVSSSGNAGGNSLVITDEGINESSGAETPVIYKMNLDGTNKTKVFECPSGVQIDTTYILNGNDLYTFFIKSKSIETGSNSYTSVETERILVKINLETGKYDELFNGNNREILGVYNNNIVLEEIDYKQDPENFLTDDTGYINNLNNSTKVIKLFNLSNLEETEIYKDVYKNMSEISCNNGKVYFIGINSTKLECLDLQTKQKETLYELPKTGASIQGIYDNKLQYVYYSGNTGKVDSAYYIDLATKENKNFKLVDDNDYLVEILSESNDYYFVKTGYEMGDEYTSWAGTTQQDIEKTNYALIKKEDYWNSKAEYIDMQNTD